MKQIAPLLLACAALLGCAEEATAPAGADTGAAGPADTGGAEPPLELTPDLCDDASNMDALLDALGDVDEGEPSYGEINLDQVTRMVLAPTEGPFYMVNLIRFRAWAEYPDGRETDLTGREANDLYAPIEFLEAIGARIVFAGDVAWTTDGEEGAWEQVAIVEYPCPIALFAMSAHPEFQERAVHKEAGVEATIVMVTHPGALDDTPPEETPYPATDDDPDFERVQVLRYADPAEMKLYADGVRDAERAAGVYPKARLAVEGVFIGDDRAWDDVWIDYMPSRAAYDALAADPAVQAAAAHRDAAVEEAYGVAVHPLISAVPSDGG